DANRRSAGLAQSGRGDLAALPPDALLGSEDAKLATANATPGEVGLPSPHRRHAGCPDLCGGPLPLRTLGRRVSASLPSSLSLWSRRRRGALASPHSSPTAWAVWPPLEPGRAGV